MSYDPLAEQAEHELQAYLATKRRLKARATNPDTSAVEIGLMFLPGVVLLLIAIFG